MTQIPPAQRSGGLCEALEALPVSYLEVDAHGVIARANAAAHALHADLGHRLIGTLVWNLMPLAERERSRAAFNALMESGQGPAVTRRSVLSRSGEFRSYDVHRSVIRDGEGRATGMRVLTTDVTEAERRLEEATASLRRMQWVRAALPMPVIVTDALGMIVDLNPAAEALTGWKAGELQGRLIEEGLVLHSFVSDEPIDYQRVLSSRTRWAATLVARGGQEKQIEISTSPIVDEQTGGIAGVVSVWRPIESAA